MSIQEFVEKNPTRLFFFTESECERIKHLGFSIMKAILITPNGAQRGYAFKSNQTVRYLRSKLGLKIIPDGTKGSTVEIIE